MCIHVCVHTHNYLTTKKDTKRTKKELSTYALFYFLTSFLTFFFFKESKRDRLKKKKVGPQTIFETAMGNSLVQRMKPQP